MWPRLPRRGIRSHVVIWCVRGAHFNVAASLSTRNHVELGATRRRVLALMWPRPDRRGRRRQARIGARIASMWPRLRRRGIDGKIVRVAASRSTRNLGGAVLFGHVGIASMWPRLYRRGTRTSSCHAPQKEIVGMSYEESVGARMRSRIRAAAVCNDAPRPSRFIQLSKTCVGIAAWPIASREIPDGTST